VAQPRLRAEFFVRPDGVAIPKAPPLKRSVCWRIFERDGRQCQECGVMIDRLGHNVSPFTRPQGAIDHMFPRSRGGQNDDDNLRLLCVTCNASKGAK
jgi:5-methylcytosine-specific restriction endonuclease McrA